MDIHGMVVLSVEGITGADGNGQSSDNRRFPAASGFSERPSRKAMAIAAVAGHHSDGMCDPDGQNVDTDLNVTVSGTDGTFTVPALYANLKYGIDIASAAMDLSWTWMLSLRRQEACPDMSGLSIVSGGSPDTMNDRLWLCNKSAPLRKVRARDGYIYQQWGNQRFQRSVPRRTGTCGNALWAAEPGRAERGPSSRDDDGKWSRCDDEIHCHGASGAQ